MHRLEESIFWGAGGPLRVSRCQTTQLAPSVNVPRIRRRLVARFGSKPFLDEIHSILSFCVGRMSISMGKWEALDGFPNQEHRSTSDDECIVRHSSGDAIKKFMVTSESQMWHELRFVPQVTRVHF